MVGVVAITTALTTVPGRIIVTIVVRVAILIVSGFMLLEVTIGPSLVSMVL